MGYQESWFYIEPQWKFEKMIRAYEKAENSGYYKVAGAVEEVLRPDDHRLEGINLDSAAPSENAYMRRYSVENYAHRMRAGLAR